VAIKEGVKMRLRGILVGAMLTGGIAILPAAAAFASGPGGGSGNGSGNNGRLQQTIQCANGQTYTVAITQGGQSNGAGQIVDANGHGIPAFGTFTVTDTTANVVLFQRPIGHGSGHGNQTTTECTGQAFTGTVADLGPPPPGGYPAGVLPSDTAVGSVDVFVILKV
jgi:hypothetical protein